MKPGKADIQMNVDMGQHFPSVCPSNITRILIIFGPAIDLSRGINPIDYGFSMLIF